MTYNLENKSRFFAARSRTRFKDGNWIGLFCCSNHYIGVARQQQASSLDGPFSAWPAELFPIVARVDDTGNDFIVSQYLIARIIHTTVKPILKVFLAAFLEIV